MKTSYFFGENNLKSFFRPGWKGMGDPGVEEVETRVYVKPERGCRAVYLPCLRRFYALFLIIIQSLTIYVSPIFAIIIYKRHFQDGKELDYQSFLGHSHVWIRCCGIIRKSLDWITSRRC